MYLFDIRCLMTYGPSKFGIELLGAMPPPEKGIVDSDDCVYIGLDAACCFFGRFAANEGPDAHLVEGFR